MNKNKTMSFVLRSKLPLDVVNYIKLFTGEAMWYKGRFILIHRIPKSDFRFSLLRTLPKNRQLCNDNHDHPKRGCAWFKLDNGKFVVITVRYAHLTPHGYPNGYVWEMHYNEKVTCIYLP
jgi:hypothetical protein